MKYYAVTDDPRELMHYGIKGMKWGILRSDTQLGHKTAPKMPKGMKSKQKERSEAFKRASAKLSSAMKNGIQKAKDRIDEYNSPAAKAERRFQKHLEQARKGTLKYKKVSSDEIYRIADRLNMERASRALSGAEQTFRNKLRTSIGEGIVRGAGQGVASSIQTRLESRARTKAAIRNEKQMARFHNSLSGRLAANREDRAADRKMRREVKRDADKAYYVERAEEGLPIDTRFGTVARNTGKVIGRSLNLGLNPFSKYARGKAEFTVKDLDWTGARRSSRAKYLSDAKKRAQDDKYESDYRAALAKERAKAEAKRLYGNGGENNPNPGGSNNPRPNSGSSNHPRPNPTPRHPRHPRGSRRGSRRGGRN